MVEKRSATIIVALLLALGVSARGAGPFQQVGADGLVIMEAEDFDANISQGGHDFVLVTDPPGFSGTGAMQSLPDSGTNVNVGYVTGSPHLDFQVNFTKTGTHYVWLRAHTNGGGADDSAHSGLDGQAIATADRISVPSTAPWVWTNAAYQDTDPPRIVFDVKTTGLHTFNLYMREDGSIFDKVVLTTNPNYTPTGLGPSLKATQPSPSSGQTGVVAPLLSWQAGASTLMNVVYLGRSPDLGPTDIVSPQQPFAVYFHIPGFEPGVTYYWRIDGIEADMTTTYAGDVWSFTAAPTTAYGPGPRDGDKWIAKDTTLTWLPGQGAVSHEVYFGTDKNVVTSRDAGTFKGKLVPATFKPGALGDNTTYYWAVDETDSTGKKSAGSVWSFTTIGPGGGVKGEYFTGMMPGAAPNLTRMDPAINFSWGNDGPGTPIGVDGFSARWTADLEIVVEDTYTFITTSDDGARLWLNDQLIIDRWVDQSPADAASKALLLKPGIYSLRMEYYENGGGAVAQLSWRTPTMTRQIIPAGPLQPPVRAKVVYPPSGDANVPQDVTLLWSAGQRAAKHDVYFGEDQAAVAAADTSSSLYKGRQALDKTSFAPGALDWNKSYFWRIDEVNDASTDSPWKGAVWTFTTANFIVVDDMESYTDDDGNRIYQAWVDGWTNNTGAVVGNLQAPFAERGIVHGGKQSMPMDYNNIKTPFYSEAELDLAPVQNWTVNGVDTLSLWFRGSPARFVDKGNGAFTVGASGHDIWDNADDFRFVYKQLSGNGSVTVKVESLVNTNAWAKAGVMIRENLDAGSPMAYMIQSFSSGASFGWRQTAGGTPGSATQVGITAPQWVKLTRTGNAFTAQYSADGKTWKDIVDTTGKAVSTNVMMGANVYIGLCTTSHNTAATTTAEYSGAATTGGVTGSWKVAWVGDDPDRTNSTAALYAAVEDSAGKVAVVTHPDPAAVNVTAWTQWKTPLSSLTGVNLAKVKKLYIGVGDRKTPAADGTGRIYIDDIRVTKP